MAQFGELTAPAEPDGAAGSGVIVLLHGGFWRARYGLELGRPLALELARRGWWCWNLEYRRVGNGGGWPATCSDVGLGIDHLGVLAERHPTLDLRRVLAIGHSAGGHLAVWAAGRRQLSDEAPGAAPGVALAGVISQAGVLDLAAAVADDLGDGAAATFMGGQPQDLALRYRHADPTAQLPLPVPVHCVHSRADTAVPFSQSADYVRRSQAAGGRATLHEVTGDHMSLVDPSSADWRVVLDLLAHGF